MPSSNTNSIVKAITTPEDRAFINSRLAQLEATKTDIETLVKQGVAPQSLLDQLNKGIADLKALQSTVGKV